MKEVFGLQTNVEPQCADEGTHSPRSHQAEIDLACLAGARRAGLMRRQESAAVFMTSACPSIVWWGRREGGENRSNANANGGPWSVETVERLIERGLLSLNPYHQWGAYLTTEGKRAIRKPVAARGRSE